jgi:ABC-2 type transport system permease protein
MSALETLRYYARLYILIESQYIKARLQYRTDFIISTIGMVLRNLMGILVFWAIFTSIPTLNGWSFFELLFMYGFYLLAVSPVQIFFDNIWSLRTWVQDGAFLKYYFRPLNMMFYYLSDMFDLKGIPQVIVALVALGYASYQLQLVWTPTNILLLVIMVFSAATVWAAIMVIAASSAFWIINSYPLLSFAFKLRDFAPYPITIFDGFFRILFTLVIPLGFVSFYPAQLFLRSGDVPLLTYASPLVAIATFAIAYWVWVQGVNHYSGTGS